LDWHRITIFDAHTAGEPLRIIASGFPELSGYANLAKWQFASTDYDHRQ
jgi:trans-L-3-hydroxyproline dehydratase